MPFMLFTQSGSFMVNFDPSQDPQAATRIDEIWSKLSEGGMALMPLGEYPFSKRYGWIQDKFGVSWQLILTNPEGEKRPTIMPFMLFTQAVCGKAEEATDFYLSVFKKAKRGALSRYPAGMAPEKEGTIMFTDFTLNNQWFVAMDSAQDHKFTFNEAVSLIVNCDNQEEIDYYWEKLSAVPEAEQCGWVKDKYGVSWQIVPTNMDELMKGEDASATQRKTQAMLQMKKIDIQTIKQA
jgi:predicted 3-demethylubiquinone-9 3-methyltransferase (glyoxalase superfamily)